MTPERANDTAEVRNPSLTAEIGARACECCDRPGQDCFTAGLAVVAAEGLCGPCAMRLMSPATPPTEFEAIEPDPPYTCECCKPRP